MSVYESMLHELSEEKGRSEKYQVLYNHMYELTENSYEEFVFVRCF